MDYRDRSPSRRTSGSHHHRRHRSRSRSRSPSPPAPKLNNPDPLTPSHSPLAAKIINDLIHRHGKHYSIHDLIRQPDSSLTRPDPTTSIPLSTGGDQSITIQVPSKYIDCCVLQHE